VKVGYERSNESLFIVVHGGADLDAVTDLRIDGATINQGFDVSADRPRAKVLIDPPTTVTVTATFEDGTSQVIAEWSLD